VQDMTRMFSACSSLTTIDISGFNTDKVQDTSCMFCNCSQLKTIDLSRLNLSNVKDMHGMFNNCFNLSLVIFGSDVSSLEFAGHLLFGGINTNGTLKRPSYAKNFTLIACELPRYWRIETY
jgi:surface protein